MNNRETKVAGPLSGCRALLILCLGLSLSMAACGKESPVAEDRHAPDISGVSSPMVSPGDSLIIYGQHFAPQAGSNLVVFNNTLAGAVPYTATSTRLELLVPGNAASGPMWVVSYGTASDSVTMEVSRGVGEVWVVGAGGDPYAFKVKSTTSNESFLIIPHAAVKLTGTFSYNIAPGNAVSYPPPAGTSGSDLTSLGLQEKFTERARREVIDYLESHAQGSRTAPSEEPIEEAPPDTMSFYVLNTIAGSPIDPANFTPVTATLRYSGSRCYIYSDQNMPAAGFVQADYDSFGMDFDDNNNGIFVTDSTYFGTPTDINNDNHVVILFTPVVDDLTPDGTAQQQGFIAGFFLLNDLIPGLLPAGTTNGMEIFYAMVPDPSGQYGNVFPKNLVKRVTPNVLAHELEHMISFGHRYFTYGISYLQNTWLEEGMAHIAEDLNGNNGDNVLRADLYLADAGAVSLMGNDTLEQRGAIYMFLRYVGDQLGNTVFKQILQTSKTGTASVEQATGEGFFTTFSDWLATLYLSGRGITSDPRYNYTSIDLQDFDPLSTTAWLVSQGAFNDDLRGSAGDFYVIDGPTPPGIEFSVTPSAISSILQTAIVRIQ